MSFFKRALIILVLVIVFGSVISVFLPSNFFLERTIVVDADKAIVFNQVNNLKEWKNWSAWADKDPEIYKLEDKFSNPSYGEGASFRWHSKHKEVDEGTIKIVETIKDDTIKTVVNFGMGDALANWSFTNVADGVEVKWSLTVDFGFSPFAKFFGLFMEGMVASDYEKGLQNLKLYAEDLPKIHRVVVAEKMLDEAIWMLSIRDTVKQKEMDNIQGKSFERINQYLEELNAVSAGFPLVIYHLWSADKVDIEIGIPIKDSTVLSNGNIHLNVMPKTKVVYATHYGSYDRLPETYFGINEYMRKNKVVVNGPPWESYLTDPATEPNPSNWKTEIYFPIN
ncbi:MAG: SRPBCC family protein [Vicingaceae bacterium]